jgi:hypothetical protein
MRTDRQKAAFRNFAKAPKRVKVKTVLASLVKTESRAKVVYWNFGNFKAVKHQAKRSPCFFSVS